MPFLRGADLAVAAFFFAGADAAGLLFFAAGFLTVVAVFLVVAVFALPVAAAVFLTAGFVAGFFAVVDFDFVAMIATFRE